MTASVPRMLGAALSSVLLAGLAARPASATLLVAADLGELVEDARVIVHGRVVATSPQWLEARRGIETIVTLAVEDALKGGVVREVSFRVPGGQMGPYRSMLVGAPAFSEGDDVIVFLGGSGPAIPHLVGFTQGVYRVRVDADGVRVIAPGVALAAPDRNTAVTRGRATAQPLAAFESKIHDLVRRSRGERRPVPDDDTPRVPRRAHPRGELR